MAEERKKKSELVGRTAPPAGASICINPITFSPVHGTVLAPIYHTERCLLRSTSRANALTIQNFPTSVQELSSELTVLTFKLSNQITIQQPVDTTAISRTDTTAILRTICCAIIEDLACSGFNLHLAAFCSWVERWDDGGESCAVLLCGAVLCCCCRSCCLCMLLSLIHI